MTQQDAMDEVAFRAFDLLIRTRNVLVTAESCTAGLIAATLARVPGMSACLAGSFVVYQIDSKVAWLEVPAEMIIQHDVVSLQVAETMAVQALRKTAHATIAMSITGHLGPAAPEGLDGVAWLGFAGAGMAVSSKQFLLEVDVLQSEPDKRSLFVRHERQKAAVVKSLAFLCHRLAEQGRVRLTS
jgi:PncC family amidohydrolase